MFCSSPKKQSPVVGEYRCIRCGSIAKVLSHPERTGREISGYYYKVSKNWKDDCDEALILNVHIS